MNLQYANDRATIDYSAAYAHCVLDHALNCTNRKVIKSNKIFPQALILTSIAPLLPNHLYIVVKLITKAIFDLALDLSVSCTLLES